jgi:hypothetical protein
MIYDPKTCSFQCEGCGQAYECPRRVAWNPHARMVMQESLESDHRLCSSAHMLDLFEIVSRFFGVQSSKDGGRGESEQRGEMPHSMAFSPYLRHHRDRVNAS